MSETALSPRQGLNPRQAETVERLMMAGQAELDEVGPDALTMRTVAQRAGVSPATAYTYLASKHHLFAELFLRTLAEHAPEITGGTPVERVRSVTRHWAALLKSSPNLAVAANHALLGSDPDVDRLRIAIGVHFVDQLRTAYGEAADPQVLDALVLAFTGALLQAGMGLIEYDDLARRLDGVVAAILEGHPTT